MEYEPIPICRTCWDSCDHCCCNENILKERIKQLEDMLVELQVYDHWVYATQNTDAQKILHQVLNEGRSIRMTRNKTTVPV